jgi:SAM-dependent methyltransferase
MMPDYRKRFYESYVTDHLQFNYQDASQGFELLRILYHRQYLTLLPADKDIPILDIACGQGQFLYFLEKEGYTNCSGIDWSEEQLDIARKMGVTQEQYGVIIANHIIEHLRKDEAVRLLDAVHGALRPGGIVIVGTPNASYLFAARHRYIDFTHELGFTSESLGQLLRACKFQSVEVCGEKPAPYGVKSAVRAGLWYLLDALTKAYFAVAYGVNDAKKIITEPSMFAVGRKTGPL